MKTTIYKTAALVLATMLALASCGNAGAENKKTKAPKDRKQIIELTAGDFSAKVYDISKENPVYLGDRPAVVDFYATWCGPCQRIAPIMNELAAEYGDSIVIYKIDIDQAPEVARAFGVRSIPAVLYIPTGDEPVMTVGSRDKARFRSEIDTILLGK